MVYCAKDMLHFIVLHDFLFDGLNWNFVVEISLHFLSLHCIWWLCTGWWGGKVYTLSIVLLLISFDYTLHTVHCIVLHRIALHCIVLHCIVLYCRGGMRREIALARESLLPLVAADPLTHTFLCAFVWIWLFLFTLFVCCILNCKTLPFHLPEADCSIFTLSSVVGRRSSVVVTFCHH